MKRTNWGILLLLVLVASVAVGEKPTQSITVDCMPMEAAVAAETMEITVSKLNV